MLRTLPDPKNATNSPGAEECYEPAWGRRVPRSLLGPESWSPPGPKERWEPLCLGPTNAANPPGAEECHEPSLEAEECYESS